MPVNNDKPHLWKKDILKSVDFYNDWFLRFAPKAFLDTRFETAIQVRRAFQKTNNLTRIEPDVLIANPTVLPILRMSTAPPIARDRLIGLSGVTGNLVKSMELNKRIPPRMEEQQVIKELYRIGTLIQKIADVDICPWLGSNTSPQGEDIHRAATIIADRLCGALADPIIRNEQEKRQLGAIGNWLNERGYRPIQSDGFDTFQDMPKGTYSFRLNVPITLKGNKKVNIPIDSVVQPIFFLDKQISATYRSQISRRFHKYE